MANDNIPSSPAEHLQQLNILFLALLAGQVMIAGILYFMTQSKSEGEETATSFGDLDVISIAGILMFVSLAVASFFVYNKRKEEGRQLSGSLMDKLNHYRASFVMRAALLEGPNLVLLLLYAFMGGSIILLAVFGIGLVLFTMIRPTTDKIIEDYNLSASEQSELRSATI